MTSGWTTSTSRPGAVSGARPAQSPPGGGPGRRFRPVLAAVVVVLLVTGTVAALSGPSSGPSGPSPAAAAPATSEAFAVTPPSGWTPAPAGTAPLDVFGVPFVRLAEVPPFAAGECPPGAAPRGVAAAALVAVPAGTTVEQAAQAFARGAGESAYAGSTPQVAVGPAVPRPGGTEPGSWVEATVRTDGLAAGAAGCRATDGAVGVLAVPRTRAQDGSTGVAMLVTAADAGGGPGDPVPGTDLADLATSAVPPP
ncbi:MULTISPECIES: hypothetical protein [unclassified Pseudonocardia]|uniref:hypothetical protein n=1 Tax=unclassified Pseudonocardia TaxID=2619320 RepID=UPI00094AC278|nr:hypothetical protein [Pseudonocardia sp. Ae707_Ps1]OLM17229.1 Signal transduction response regulator / Disease resistance domain-containing protein [Pseudonocardia sp. Ae707_Ps1]